MQVRAKMAVIEVARNQWGSRKVTFQPQYDQSIPEDQRFQKATPSGSIEMLIDNPPVAEFFEQNLGKAFYVDFTPVVP
jgi:hypothetical protein